MEFVLVKGQEEVIFQGFSTYNLGKIEGLADKLQQLYDDSENKYLVEYFILIIDRFLGYEIDKNSSCGMILDMYTDVVFYGAVCGVDTKIFTDIKPWLEYFIYACHENSEAQELSIQPSTIKENKDETPEELKANRTVLVTMLHTKVLTTKLG